jgi:hypothetical protein
MFQWLFVAIVEEEKFYLHLSICLPSNALGQDAKTALILCSSGDDVFHVPSLQEEHQVEKSTRSLKVGDGTSVVTLGCHVSL